MDSGGSGSGDGGGDVNPATHYNPVPIVPPRSSFFDPTSFTQSLNPNPNPNSNSMFNLDSLWSGNPNSNPVYDPYPVGDEMNPESGIEKLGTAAAARNPKKRTRASRRAPTTVLTTDTTNFRQMVQEFTGIPNTPFSASSSSSNFSRRLDLYGGGSGIAIGNLPVQPFRPSAQKIQLTATSNFHFPPSETHARAKQPLSLSNLQNQMFPFQSVSPSTIPQQINATERENQRSEQPDAYFSSSSTSLKRWRGQNENLVNFEGRNGNSQDDVVALRNDGDQNPGNDDSWICPSD